MNLHKEHPMETMPALVDRLAAQLQEKGIDPANFTGYVPRAVETLTTDRAEAGALLEFEASRHLSVPCYRIRYLGRFLGVAFARLMQYQWRARCMAGVE